MTLEEERRELDNQRRKLDIEKKEFIRRVEIEDRRLEREQQLFSMKVKILEEELIKLATEKEEVQKKKDFYERVYQYETYSRQEIKQAEIIRGELFFRGVENKQSLKKRYKDLIKIYHPDNLDGDNNTVQEINKEYHYLSQMFV